MAQHLKYLIQKKDTPHRGNSLCLFTAYHCAMKEKELESNDPLKHKTKWPHARIGAIAEGKSKLINDLSENHFYRPFFLVQFFVAMVISHKQHIALKRMSLAPAKWRQLKTCQVFCFRLLESGQAWVVPSPGPSILGFGSNNLIRSTFNAWGIFGPKFDPIPTDRTLTKVLFGFRFRSRQIHLEQKWSLQELQKWYGSAIA